LYHRDIIEGLSSDFPDSDIVVCVTSKQGGSISAPCKGNGSRVLFALGLEFSSSVLEISNEVLAFEIPDLNSLVSTSAQPVSSWAEDEGVDDLSGFEGVEVLAFVQVPESGSAVSASRGTQRTIRRDGDTVDVSSVSRQVGSQLAVGQVPDLDLFVPSTGDDDRVLCVWRESNTAHPVTVSLILDGVLALTEGVPQLDGLVSRSRDDLSVISREGNTQNILGVSNESSGGGSVVQVPQSESSVP